MDTSIVFFSIILIILGVLVYISITNGLVSIPNNEFEENDYIPITDNESVKNELTASEQEKAYNDSVKKQSAEAIDKYFVNTVEQPVINYGKVGDCPPAKRQTTDLPLMNIPQSYYD